MALPERPVSAGCSPDRTDEGFFRAIIDGITDPVLVIGLNHEILLVNAAAQDLLYKGGSFCSGRKCHEVLHRCSQPCDTTGSDCLVREMRTAKKPLQLTKTHRSSSGKISHFEIFAFPVLDADGQVEAVIEICRNVTRSIEAETAVSDRDRRLRHLALHDPLTDLGNRTYLLEKLNDVVTAGKKFALLFVDLDAFKTVNDSLGHGKGDLVLLEVAGRLREGFGATTIIARLGGDEFALIVEDIDDPGKVPAIARQALDAVSQIMTIGDDRIYVTGSIGIALFPDDSGDVEGLLAAAEVAMTRSKGDARDDYRFFSAAMIRRGRNDLLLETDLRDALRREAVTVHYQPIIDLRTGELKGAEALVRWPHPTKGLLYPGAFISVAEETGLIVPLSDLVVRIVCRDIARWTARGLAAPKISVNVSAREFRQANLVELLSTRLAERNVDPRLIELEVTETTLMTDVESAAVVMKQLKDLGIGLAIDDFGTGYSSLSYLRKFPIDKLKIDYSFVTDVVHDENSAAIASAVIALAHSMGLTVVAEGIETHDQLEFLNERGCDLGQGYLFNRAIAPEEFEERFLEKQSKKDAQERRAKPVTFFRNTDTYRSVFENNHTPMLVILPDTAEIVDANSAACALYGYTKNQMLSLKITDINTLPQSEVREQMQAAAEGTACEFHFPHRLSSGEIRYVEVHSGPIMVAGKQLLFSIIHDVTARKKAGDALKEDVTLDGRGCCEDYVRSAALVQA